MTLRLLMLAAAAVAVLLLGASAVAAKRGLPSPVTWLDDSAHEAGTPVEGAYAVQQRGYFSITVQLHTRGLAAGHRYTLWWVVFNNPSACTDGCDSGDLASVVSTGANPAGIGVHYGGSVVAPASGRLDVGSRVLENQVVGCPKALPYRPLCTPLVDAAVAEATVFLVDHGPATAGPAISGPLAFSAGCKSYKTLAAVVTAYASTGFECYSPQSVHLP